ncbi:hypothetical protein IAT40_006582 [Kwoniella sp. CBS 6097]
MRSSHRRDLVDSAVPSSDRLSLSPSPASGAADHQDPPAKAPLNIVKPKSTQPKERVLQSVTALDEDLDCLSGDSEALTAHLKNTTTHADTLRERLHLYMAEVSKFENREGDRIVRYNEEKRQREELRAQQRQHQEQREPAAEEALQELQATRRVLETTKEMEMTKLALKGLRI